MLSLCVTLIIISLKPHFCFAMHISDKCALCGIHNSGQLFCFNFFVCCMFFGTVTESVFSSILFQWCVRMLKTKDNFKIIQNVYSLSVFNQNSVIFLLLSSSICVHFHFCLRVSSFSV